MAKIRLKEPYLGNIALCLVAAEAIEELQEACEELGHVAEAATRAHVAIAQLHEDWANWLEDPTQETLQPVLADLHDLKALQPRLYQEVLSFFEPADQEITAHLNGKMTLGDVHAKFLDLTEDPHQMPSWARAISEANILEITILDAIAKNTHPTLCLLYGQAQAVFHSAIVQPVSEGHPEAPSPE